MIQRARLAASRLKAKSTSSIASRRNGLVCVQKSPPFLKIEVEREGRGRESGDAVGGVFVVTHTHYLHPRLSLPNSLELNLTFVS